jgi:DNA helicase II / ATP-dependent DNA helicase PcrA
MLNEKQIEAINHKEGPCLVLAGAGSGKTKVLTERIVKLINDDVKPSEILAITFTNKAAKEMRNRVSNKIFDLADQIFLGTFHSFGFKILRENASVLGYNKNITILDRNDALSIIKKIMKELNIDPEYIEPSFIISQISFAKNEGLSPDEYGKYMKGEKFELIPSIYSKYIEMLKRNNSVDFDDLLILPYKILKNNKDILERYQNKFKYILVDEYQDTNQVQYDLCKILASKYKNIFVVGDIDQSIYGWRNANYRNVLNFEKDYKDAKVILLEENYRSTGNILKAANSVIKNNKNRKEKNLFSSKEEGAKIKYVRVENEDKETSYVIDKIKNYHKNGYKYSDIGVLYRTNAQSRKVEEALVKENIPYKIIGSYFFYNRKEIKDLIAYLNLIYNKNDDISLERIINTPKRKIGEKTIEELREKARINNISMFDAIEDSKELIFKKIILELIEDEKKMSVYELIEEVLLKSGIKSSLENSHLLEDEIRLENLEEFRSVALNFEEKGIYSLEEFLENISLVSDKEQYKNEDNDGVNVMTLHSAKGLEFNIVFILGMEEGIFPHSRSFYDEEEMEEERRLCYVGITRAKEQLYLLNAKKRMLFGKINSNEPSRFISEIDQKLLEIEEEKEKEKFINNMYNKNINNDLKPGDNVKHDIFGNGVVVQVDKNIAKIAFRNGVGVKLLAKNHKCLHKINNLFS